MTALTIMQIIISRSHHFLFFFSLITMRLLFIPTILIWCFIFPNVFSMTTIHKEGYCSMRGQCGSRGFSQLPCAKNEPATLPETSSFSKLLVETCGITGPACCDESQLEDLVEQVKRAESIIASCPACWHNFLQFWCSFTCSPNQSMFVNITSVIPGDQKGDFVVNSTDYWVGNHFGSQFFDSCKDIKFGSSNGYAMDFIGGGAKVWHDMVTYMGQLRPMMGSPFQIDFPAIENVPQQGLVRYDEDGKLCNDTDAAYRCACVDCEAVCPILPPTPSEEPECHVGLLHCWSFAMLMTYVILLALGLVLTLARTKSIGRLAQKYLGIDADREESRASYERLALSDDAEEDENLLDPDYTPRRYWLNSRLQNWFYYQGLFCARYPWFVIMTSLGFVMVCSLGWSRFSLERNPVNLWVSPSSTALAQKNHFDENFTPFYRTSQIFLVTENGDPIASAEHLTSLFKLEQEIKDLKSIEFNDTLQDVCFHPNGDICIVQSVTGYWQSDIENFDPESWKSYLQSCASQPSTCLPEFQQPLKPEMILGGYQGANFTDAQAFVITYVLTNSINANETIKAERWENTLLSTILTSLNQRPEWEGVRISYSTEVSK